MAGVESTAGSRSRKGFVPTETVGAIQRLEDAGAVIFARTTVPEFCYFGITESELLAGHPTRGTSTGRREVPPGGRRPPLAADRCRLAVTGRIRPYTGSILRCRRVQTHLRGGPARAFDCRLEDAGRHRPTGPLGCGRPADAHRCGRVRPARPAQPPAGALDAPPTEPAQFESSFRKTSGSLLSTTTCVRHSEPQLTGSPTPALRSWRTRLACTRLSTSGVPSLSPKRATPSTTSSSTTDLSWARALQDSSKPVATSRPVSTSRPSSLASESTVPTSTCSSEREPPFCSLDPGVRGVPARQAASGHDRQCPGSA